MFSWVSVSLFLSFGQDFGTKRRMWTKRKKGTKRAQIRNIKASHEIKFFRF